MTDARTLSWGYLSTQKLKRANQIKGKKMGNHGKENHEPCLPSVQRLNPPGAHRANKTPPVFAESREVCPGTLEDSCANVGKGDARQERDSRSQKGSRALLPVAKAVP